MNLKNMQKNCEGYIVAKSKRQQQIARMRKLGFNNNQIGVVLESASKKAEELQRIATEKSFLYMLAIPLNVLVNDYWEKSARKRIPKFIEDVISLYEAVQKGVVSEQQLADLLDEYAGVKIEADWLKGESEDEVGRLTDK
jgi:DNA-binding transcriptional MerR regulator